LSLTITLNSPFAAMASTKHTYEDKSEKLVNYYTHKEDPQELIKLTLLLYRLPNLQIMCCYCYI